MKHGYGKKILVLGAGFYYFRALKMLLDADFTVYAVDRDPDAYGAPFVHGFAPIDIKDKATVLAWATQQKIDGILPVNDFGTRTAAFVSERLGLVGITPQAAHAANDKGVMRDVWKTQHLPQPEHQVVHHLVELQDVISTFGYPCVLKPTDCGGSGRGISIIRDESEIDWAYRFAAPFAQNQRFIVETFVEGLELTIESFSQQGHVTILTTSDKVKPDLRTRVATSLNYPAAISTALQTKLETIVSQAVLALGITEGMAHTEVIITPNEEIFLLETGARGGGGHIFHTIIEAVTDFNAPVAAALRSMGETIDTGSLHNRGAVYRFFNPPPGILRDIHGLGQARTLPGVLDLAVIKKPGDTVGVLENSLQRAGFVVTSGKDRQEAIDRADAVESVLSFEVEPFSPEVKAEYAETLL